MTLEDFDFALKMLITAKVDLQSLTPTVILPSQRQEGDEVNTWHGRYRAKYLTIAGVKYLHWRKVYG